MPVVELKDRRPVSGHAADALKRVLSEIKTGQAANVIVASVRRDGSLFTYADGEDPVKQLGALECIKASVIKRQLNVFDADAYAPPPEKV